MAGGKPIVATMVAGNPLVVREGVNGYLVPERQANLLAVRLEVRNPLASKRDRFGVASRAMAEGEFSWTHIARRYLSHYKRLSVAAAGQATR